MKNYRKVLLGFAYLIICGILGYEHITKIGVPFEGIGLGVMFTGLATGVGAVIYGNVKEHQHTKQ